MSRPSQVATAVRALLEPVVADAGLYLEDVSSSAGRPTVVRIVVDLPDGPGGVGSDALTDVSRAISAALDDADVVRGAYTLEVSTPGVGRPLTDERHYRRAVGRLLRLTTGDGPLRGRLTTVEGEVLHLEIDGTTRTVPLAHVTSGTVEPELNRPTTEDEG
ncbi:ribosome maturation factor RimP [Georgenia sunbinii]|uniref:ribosome maturation factor RimP n=1 Tax=Georgenia sunbinii TaxID=3117728 RepID=UPI002F2670FE